MLSINLSADEFSRLAEEALSPEAKKALLQAAEVLRLAELKRIEDAKDAAGL